MPDGGGGLSAESVVEPPLVVDLDGTLLRSDLLLETGLAFLRKHPLRILHLLAWLRAGKAVLKSRLARAVEIDVTVLPYDPQVIALIEGERNKGRRIVLATASDGLLAERIAEHLQLFDEVIASGASRNLSRHRKKEALIHSYGEGGYDYAGNSHDDVPAWGAARRAYVVNPQRGVERRALSRGNVEAVIKSNPPTLRNWAKALRLHQWLKNLLIFVPLLTAHRMTEVSLLGRGLLAFLFFGLCASSVYILNDLLDLADDRQHPTKQRRPFAAGRLSITSGLIASPLLLIVAFIGALGLLPLQFAAVLGAYYLLALAYSLFLKRRMVVDVIVLAVLYTLRIIASAAALGIVLTFWILAFSMFIFLSLALVKRFTEVRRMRVDGSTAQTPGRGYYPNDLEMLAPLGVASGYLSVMVLALYVNDPQSAMLYSHPKVIWFACPLLLLWINRLWMIAHRGRMNDDPVIFAMRDRASLIIGALFGLVFWAAT